MTADGRRQKALELRVHDRPEQPATVGGKPLEALGTAVQRPFPPQHVQPLLTRIAGLQIGAAVQGPQLDRTGSQPRMVRKANRQKLLDGAEPGGDLTMHRIRVAAEERLENGPPQNVRRMPHLDVAGKPAQPRRENLRRLEMRSVALLRQTVAGADAAKKPFKRSG